MGSAARHTVIFGLGITGYSCLRFLRATDRITVVDTRASPPFAAATRAQFPDVELILGPVAPEHLAHADRIVVSPGVPTNHCLLRRAVERDVPLLSDIELFLTHATAPVLGITGTNGKSTVTALTGALLQAAGRNVGVGGNLGKPALDLLDASRELYVLELSSFQLERLGSGHFDIAANLNITPDHLDRYPDVATYAQAKQRIFVGCDVAIFNRADALTAPPVTSACRRVSIGLDAPPPGGWGIVETGGSRSLASADAALLAVAELGVRGRHNELNALASLALAHEAGCARERWYETLRDFKGLEHRCQTVAVIGGVTFINDSKATNLGACVAALEGLGEARRHIVLIAGGDAKNADLAPLRDVVGRFVRWIITLGKDAAAVADAVGDAAPIRRVATMNEAVAAAHEIARAGDLVLLSPACASLDMYTNFEARGRDFADAVLGYAR